MNVYSPADIHRYATRLTQACQAAGLDAEQYGAEILIRGSSHHLSERIVCKVGSKGRLRWHWSWGAAIGRLGDSSQLLDPGDVGELVRSIQNVVTTPLRGTERF